MSKELAPAFQFYAADFLSDFHVQQMSMEEEGCYIHLLALCWREGSLSSNPDALRRCCKGVEPSSLVLDCFQERNGRLTHPRLDRERDKQKKWREIKSKNGKEGASARWNKDNKIDGSAIAEPSSSNGRPNGPPLANDSSSVFSLQPTAKKLLCELGKRCNGKMLTCRESFEKFWVIYPNHKPSRQEALKAWCKVHHSGVDVEKICDWIRKAKPGWTEKRFIPYAPKFLNQRYWEGDLPAEMEPENQYELYKPPS